MVRNKIEDGGIDFATKKKVRSSAQFSIFKEQFKKLKQI